MYQLYIITVITKIRHFETQGYYQISALFIPI